MDKTELVERNIEDGKRLIAELDKNQFPVIAAFWLFDEDSTTWTLHIATPLFENGTQEAYSELSKIMFDMKPILSFWLGNVALRRPNDPFIERLRVFVATPEAPHIGSIEVRKTAIGDTFIDRAFIYRAARSQPSSAIKDWLFPIPTDDEKKWRGAKGKVTFKDGYVVDVEVEGHDLKKSKSKNGLNVNLWLFTKAVTKDNKPFADVQVMRVLDGRVRNVEDKAWGVEIISDAPVATQTTMTS